MNSLRLFLNLNKFFLNLSSMKLKYWIKLTTFNIYCHGVFFFVLLLQHFKMYMLSNTNIIPFITLLNNPKFPRSLKFPRTLSRVLRYANWAGFFVVPPTPTASFITFINFCCNYFTQTVNTKLCMVILQINSKITSLVLFYTSLSTAQHYKTSI